MVEYMCKNCGVSFSRYNTLVTICGKCQYNRYTKPRKPIKKVGKIAKRWIEHRAKWFMEHPATNGFYSCGVCGLPVHVNETVLDHIQPRSNRPDLRFIESNLQPAHYICNQQKGSVH